MTLGGATDIGAPDPAKPIETALGLQMRDADTVKAAIAAGQTMSRDAFVAQFAPTSAQVSAAVSYLQSQGFTSIAPEPNNMLVIATGSAATVQKAFNTTLHAFSVGGSTYYANTQPAFVPTALGGNVVAVLGLTNFSGLQASFPKQPASLGLTPGTFGTNGAP